jgi:exodeoxyribonuclease VII large subunit
VLDNSIQVLDETVSGLKDALTGRLSKAADRIRQAEMAIVRIEPRRFLSAGQTRLVQLESRLRQDINKRCAEKVLQITAAENKLQALNPKAVLERGYSITTNRRTGKVITAAADVTTGDVITTELAQQERIESTVDKIFRQD